MDQVDVVDVEGGFSDEDAAFFAVLNDEAVDATSPTPGVKVSSDVPGMDDNNAAPETPTT